MDDASEEEMKCSVDKSCGEGLPSRFVSCSARWIALNAEPSRTMCVANSMLRYLHGNEAREPGVGMPCVPSVARAPSAHAMAPAFAHAGLMFRYPCLTPQAQHLRSWSQQR